ncbi:MAG: hypothetical protein J6Y77_01580 [Paludibacteraceae bacterium]|nr:hypothetical protein [Paludibacteraceae bacterium]
MKVKSLFGAVLLMAGLMLTFFTSCESEDLKTEKKLNGEWELTSVRYVELLNGEINQESHYADTTFYGTTAKAYAPICSMIFNKDGQTAFLLSSYSSMATTTFYYQVLGDRIFFKEKDDEDIEIYTVDSFSGTEIVLSYIEYEYKSYNDEETDDPENPVYDSYQYKTIMTFSKK